MTVSEKEMKQSLFKRTYNLEQEVITAKELQKELKSEFTFEKEFNTAGLDKEVVKKVMKAAVAKAKQDTLKEKAQELLELDELITELED
ncbi:hypothetical protein D3C85_378170 [compost metagenome]